MMSVTLHTPVGGGAGSAMQPAGAGDDRGAPGERGPGTHQPAEPAGGGVVDALPWQPLMFVTGSAPTALVTALLGEQIPEPPTGALTVVRYGEPSGYAYVPGHRDPRPLRSGASPVAARPPRRIELTRRSELLTSVGFVITQSLVRPGPATVDVVVDALSRTDGLIWVSDAAAVWTGAELDVIALAAQRMRTVLFVLAGAELQPHWRGLVEANRALLARRIPQLATASWHAVALHERAGDKAVAGRPEYGTDDGGEASFVGTATSGLGALRRALAGWAAKTGSAHPEASGGPREGKKK